MNILFVCALLLAPASPAPLPVTLAQSATSPPAIVKLGNASLEEYRHGDPGSRIQLGRGGQSACKP